MPPSAPAPARYCFRDIEVDPAAHTVRRAGAEVHFRPKTFQVLLYLLEHQHRSVTREELVDAVWPDGAVSADTLVHSIVELRKVLEDDAHHPTLIRTVAKSGYRFECDDIGGTGGPTPSAWARGPRRMSWRWVRRAALVLAAAAAAVWWLGPGLFQGASRSPVPRERTVAVMLLDNGSRRADLEWLRAGLADMLVTQIAHAPGLAVVGRRQASLMWERLGYPANAEVRLDRAIDVARRLGAGRVVLGSFLTIGDSVRVDLRLHDAATSRLLLADRLVVPNPGALLSGIDALGDRVAEAVTAGAVTARRP